MTAGSTKPVIAANGMAVYLSAYGASLTTPTANSDAVIAKMSNGVLDTTFNGNGIVVWNGPDNMADVAGTQVVESYFDLAIRPRPPRGVVLFAPCSFNSLNKLAHGIADNLALSVTAEAIGRGTPVIVGPSLNQPLLDHPVAQASLKKLPGWGVTIVPPVDEGEGPRLALTETLLDAVRPYVHRG